jgi:hypothetical protein
MFAPDTHRFRENSRLVTSVPLIGCYESADCFFIQSFDAGFTLQHLQTVSATPSLLMYLKPSLLGTD